MVNETTEMACAMLCNELLTSELNAHYDHAELGRAIAKLQKEHDCAWMGIQLKGVPLTLELDAHPSAGHEFPLSLRRQGYHIAYLLISELYAIMTMRWSGTSRKALLHHGVVTDSTLLTVCSALLTR